MALALIFQLKDRQNESQLRKYPTFSSEFLLGFDKSH